MLQKIIIIFSMINIIVNGSKGKMGCESVKAIQANSKLNLVAALDVEDNLSKALMKHTVDVVLDFTHPSCVVKNVETVLQTGKHCVIGTTGLSEADLERFDALAKQHNKACLVIPNFSIGAVLMMRFAAQAAKYLPNYEVIEYHHPHKADAPSGTAQKTVQLMQQATQEQPNVNLEALKKTEFYEGARGAMLHQAAVHSVRLPGFMGDQEVVFGSEGQRLKIQHISTHRSCYMPGVCLALKKAQNYTGLVYGLEVLLDC